VGWVGGKPPYIFNYLSKWKRVVSFTLQPCYSPRDILYYELHRMWVGTQVLSEHFEKNCLLFWELISDSSFVQPLA